MRRVVDALLEYLQKVKSWLAAESTSEKDIAAIFKNIMRFVGEDDFKAANPQYLQGNWYEELGKQITSVLVETRKGRDWSGAIDEVEGIDSMPIMTTHKSKGLETLTSTTRTTPKTKRAVFLSHSPEP